MTDTPTLDTSGEVRLPAGPHSVHYRFVKWSDLTSFVQGYIMAMSAGQAGWYRHHPSGEMRRWSFRDLAPETLDTIIEDGERTEPLYGIHADWGDGVRQDAGKRFWDNRQARESSAPPLVLRIGKDGKVRFASA